MITGFAIRASRFNSRSRVGSDTSSATSPTPTSEFQFTLPCRERLRSSTARTARQPFQFTLPCRERQVVEVVAGFPGRVSIHAPV